MGFEENTTFVVIVVKVKPQAWFNKKIFQKWKKIMRGIVPYIR